MRTLPIDVFHPLVPEFVASFKTILESSYILHPTMAKAGPSTAVDKSQPPPKSRSEIDSDSDASTDSPHSEDDIENVTPKRKEGLSATSGKSSTVQGKSLP